GFTDPVRVQRVELSDDPDTAVAQTIERMARYAREDSERASIQRIAAACTAQGDPVTAVWNWIRARVRFVPDRTIATDAGRSGDIAEVLIRPADIIQMHDAQGDCDDFSMLGAALFRACGVPVVFCTVAADAG